MRRLAACFLLTILASAMLVQPCLAWGPAGHQIAGMIAWRFLSDRAKAGVKDLLGDQSLGAASNWADEIRKDKSYDWSKPLHYINVPRGAQAVDMARDCPKDECVLGAIAQYTAILKDTRRPKAERLDALRFLCHFVEDVHQPLHVSYADDLGANKITVKFNGKDTNLHAVWDSGLLDMQIGQEDWMKVAERWSAAITPAQLRQLQAKPNPIAWANESLTITRRLYLDLPKNGELDDAYFKRNIGTVEDRLAMAGVRLATLLNAIFDGSDAPATQPTGDAPAATQPAATQPAATQPATAPALPAAAAPGSAASFITITQGEDCGTGDGKATYVFNSHPTRSIAVTTSMRLAPGDAPPRKQTILVSPGETGRHKLGCSANRTHGVDLTFTWTVESAEFKP